jgi:hypothetical protein
MLRCKSQFEFEKESAEESKVKRNRLILETLIVERHKKKKNRGNNEGQEDELK